MKKLLVVILLTGLTQKDFFGQEKSIGNLQTQNIPEIPTELVNALRNYQEFRSASFLGFHPISGGILISTRFGETSQLHSVERPLAFRKQLTFFKEPIVSASFCPDKTVNGLIFLKDEGGNEFSQLYWMDLISGNQMRISPGGKSQNNSPKWSNSGNQFAFTGTARNQKDYDLYIGEMLGGTANTAKIAIELTGSWSVLDWSPDNKKLILKQNISVNKSKLFLFELNTKKLEELQPSKEDIAFGNAQFSKDGLGIFFSSDEGSEFQTLKLFSLGNRRLRAITHSIRWDLGGFKSSKQRDKIAFVVNENGYDQLYLLNTMDLKYTAFENLPKGVIGAFDFDDNGKELAFSISTAQSPGDVYSVNLSNKIMRRWTESETGGLHATHFPTAQLIEYPSFDEANGSKRMIPAFVYKPQIKKEKSPVIINIHGGPEGQSRPTFNAFNAFLSTELGVTVITPNVRGSTGYGKTYVKLDNDFKREDAVKDIGMLLDWIASQPELDSSRVAVIGGSYGGYMSLACMVNYNSRLRCGVDIVGISNFVTFLKNTEDYRKDLRRVEYGDERIPEVNAFLEKISPLNQSDKITKPMFIVQGANDPRVPMSEAVQMKDKLLLKGNNVWFLLAKDEGHGFRKKTNLDFFQCSTALFFSQYLLK